MATAPTPPPASRSRAPRADKRRAVIHGARALFGRDGYARTTVEAVAAESGVSTRTIYNHHPGGKEQLFTEVLLESATGVADDFEAQLAEAVAAGDEVEDELRAVGLALVSQQVDHPEHFAMVRQINVEAAHVPDAVLRAWREAGPLRVEGAVADHLAGLAAAGRLRPIADPARTARHFIALTTSEINARSGLGAVAVDRSEIDAAVIDGVDVFLHGYAPAHPAPSASGRPARPAGRSARRTAG